MNVVHCLCVINIWKSLKNTGPDDVGGKLGQFVVTLSMERDLSSKAFMTGIKNEYSSELPTDNQNVSKMLILKSILHICKRKITFYSRIQRFIYAKY